MTQRTKASLSIDLSTGGSNDNTVETKFLVDLLDSFYNITDGLVSPTVTGGTFAGGTFTGPVMILPTYTIATKPAGIAGQIIYISDGASNKKIAIYDGVAAAWKYADGVSV